MSAKGCMKITEANRWDACIALWQALANKQNYELNTIMCGGFHGEKNKILEGLGYERCTFGCPFCQTCTVFNEWYDSSFPYVSCETCPIANIHGSKFACEERTPYMDVVEAIADRKRLRTPVRAFLAYLWELREMDEAGLVPHNRTLNNGN